VLKIILLMIFNFILFMNSLKTMGKYIMKHSNFGPCLPMSLFYSAYNIFTDYCLLISLPNVRLSHMRDHPPASPRQPCRCIGAWGTVSGGSPGRRPRAPAVAAWSSRTQEGPGTSLDATGLSSVLQWHVSRDINFVKNKRVTCCSKH